MFSKTIPLNQLESGASGCDTIELKFNGADLTCFADSRQMNEDSQKYEDVRNEIQFHFVPTYDFSSEAVCTHLPEESYDTLCEVVNSRWAKKTKRADSSIATNLFSKKHFSVYFSNHGLLNVIADRYSFKHYVLLNSQ